MLPGAATIVTRYGKQSREHKEITKQREKGLTITKVLRRWRVEMRNEAWKQNKKRKERER